MKKLLMIKCSLCGRIRKFGSWIYLGNLDRSEAEKLSWLILTDGVDYQFTYCPECLSSKRG